MPFFGDQIGIAVQNVCKSMHLFIIIIFLQLFESFGVRFESNAAGSIHEFCGDTDGKVNGVVLKNGVTLTADIIIVAIGIIIFMFETIIFKSKYNYQALYRRQVFYSNLVYI